MSMNVRILAPGDEAALEAFLTPHRASSMFLRSNVRAVGFVDDGRPLSGSYAGGFVGGALVAVAAQVWNGAVLVQAPIGAAAVAQAACAAAGRRVSMISGPAAQAAEARAALGLADAPVSNDGDETLFTLALRDLRVPAALAGGELIGRVAEARWRDQLTDWRLSYVAEALGGAIDAAARAAAVETIDRAIAAASGFVVVAAEAPEKPLAYACYNASLPDIVQIGGVWTPPEGRTHGRGRAVTAAALIAARDRGVGDAVLFTNNPAARRAYEALGFVAIDRFALVIFATPTAPR